MSKKRSWLCVIKRLFFSESHHLQQQKCKRRRWLIGRLKRTKGLPSPVAEAEQPNPVIEDITNRDAEETQKLCEENVRISTSNGDLEVPNCSTELKKNEARVPQLDIQLECHRDILAATKIQTAYRGHLARKALRALKGFVTLQAIIRGRAVRRQAVTTLKCLQSIVSIQSEVIARRRQMSQGKYKGLQLQDLRDKPKAQLNRERRMDNELLSKGEEIDLILRKKEAILRRQRTRAHSFNHRNSTDSEDRDAEGRLGYWLKQYVSDQSPKKEDKSRGKQPKLRNIEGLDDSVIISVPRRSFHTHKKQGSYAEESLHPSSPPNNLPTYMAATKSAKAKTRSLSTPRLRPIHFDAFSDGDSPYKHKLSPMSSINSEVTCSSISKVSHRSCYPSFQQKSPSLKAMSTPFRYNRNLNEIGLNNESLFVTK